MHAVVFLVVLIQVRLLVAGVNSVRAVLRG